MKTTFTVILTILITINSYSQDKNGVYLSQKYDTLIISNDSLVRFNFDYGCCLISNYYGFGKLTKSGDYQIVKTEDSDLYKGSYIRYQSSLSNSEKIELIVIDNKGNPIEGANVVTTDKKDRFIHGMASTGDYITIDKTDNLYKLTISFLGYDKIEVLIENIMGKRIDCILESGYKLTSNDIRLKFVDSDTVLLQGIYSRDYKKQRFRYFGSDLRMVFIVWPWRWRWWYKSIHTNRPLKFVKQ